MSWIGTRSWVGLCLLAACARAQSIPSRGQYSVAFKIVRGKLAVERDAFQVPPALVQFEPQIRLTVRQAIAKIGPLSGDLLIDSAWPQYTARYANWSGEDPERMDLGTLFSSDFLFANLLQQMPDSGLVLNDEDIDPLDGTISFSILPLFDSSAIGIRLPGMLEVRRRTRVPQLRKRLRRLDGALWSSLNIRSALAPLYANLGLTPQILLFPRTATIQITEGPRIASIVLPADQVPAQDLDRVLWNLLDTGHFRLAMRKKSHWQLKRVVDSDGDLGYAPGDEPYAVPYQIQELQILLSPLGYTLTEQASPRTGASPYVNLLVEAKTKGKSRHIGAGFEYRPGQDFSVIGNLQLPPLALSFGAPSGTLASGSYQEQDRAFSVAADAGVSEDRNRVLDGVKVNQQSVAEVATFGWEPWRALDGNTLSFRTDFSHAMVLNQTLNTIQPGVNFLHTDLASDYPWRVSINARIAMDLRFARCVLTAHAHRSFDRWEYDAGGRFENAFGNSPIFELPSFGGEDTVRGFRADDAIGRRLWAGQNELWRALPRWSWLKAAAFSDVGGAYQTVGSSPGLRAGLGTGLRVDVRLAVLKFDWAYGFGRAATGGSRGKFYFAMDWNAPH
jgi:hypothetical protein